MRKLLLVGCMAAMFTGTGFAVSFKNTANGVWNTGITTGNVLLGNGANNNPTYTLIHLPAGCSGANENCQQDNGSQFGPETYVVLGPNGTYPLVAGAWTLQNDTVNGANASQWIGPRANQVTPIQGGPNGDGPLNNEIFSSNDDFFVYRMVFNLGALGLNPASASISLGWLSDNRGAPDANPTNNAHIRLCGISSASDPVCNLGSMVANSGNAGQGAATLSQVSISSGFTTGLMALDFIVYNAAVPATQFNPSGLRVVINSADADTEIPEPGTLSLLGFALLGLGAYARRKR